jgi:phenylpropionate dioxygenase-like ring-hydroxylating dioxygenase large terminal subunit
MFSREENDLLTRVDPAAPMGKLFRHYWIPALLSEEISEPDGPPVRVRLLGEDLVAFRDSQGRAGLLAEPCSHRGTSLCYGRNEGGGIRCIYHGWKYDVEGNILETPAEPGDSDFRKKIRHPAYPCREAGGMVFAYMGPEEKMPLFPEYDWVGLPPANTRVVKSLLECNYLQGIEGDFDSSHVTFLHRNDMRDKQALNRDGAPQLEVDESDFGMRSISTRSAGEKKYVRISLFIWPAFSITPGGATEGFKETESRGFRFWVPIDDTHTWFYILSMRRTPYAEEEKQKFRSWVDKDYRKIRNAGNHYLQNRALQKTVSFSGIEATSVAEQDACATESMGAVYDRTKEHLGASDKTIIALRRLFLRAVREIQEGKEPPHLVRDPSENNFAGLRSSKGLLPAGASWRELLKIEKEQNEVT